MSGKDGGGQSAREDTEGAEAVVCGAQHSNCGCEGTFCIFLVGRVVMSLKFVSVLVLVLIVARPRSLS